MVSWTYSDQLQEPRWSAYSQQIWHVWKMQRLWDWSFWLCLFGCWCWLGCVYTWASYTWHVQSCLCPCCNKKKELDAPLAMIKMTENERWGNLGSLTLSSAPGILEGKSLALQAMSSSHKMMFSCCFKVTWRASGRLSCWHWDVFPWLSVLRSLKSQSLLRYQMSQTHLIIF